MVSYAEMPRSGTFTSVTVRAVGRAAASLASAASASFTSEGSVVSLVWKHGVR